MRYTFDQTTTLVIEIQAAWVKKQVATMVNLDVKGAFDEVLHNRLIFRLQN